jgi:hypothetical protein
MAAKSRNTSKMAIFAVHEALTTIGKDCDSAGRKHQHAAGANRKPAFVQVHRDIGSRQNGNGDQAWL